MQNYPHGFLLEFYNWIQKYILLIIEMWIQMSYISRFKVQGSLLFVTYTIIQGTMSSEMQVEKTFWSQNLHREKNLICFSVTLNRK